MTKHFYRLFFISISLSLFYNCQDNSSELSDVFSCENTPISMALEKVDDFQNNFTIQIPKHWKTKLYYDSIQSEIFSADTIKALSDSYIMDFSAISNQIEIDDALKAKVHQKLMDNDLITLQESFHKFKGFNAYAHLGKGTSKGMDLYVFQYYIKLNKEKYMLIKTEFYGEENFNVRFCESLALIEKIKIRK